MDRTRIIFENVFWVGNTVSHLSSVVVISVIQPHQNSLVLYLVVVVRQGSRWCAFERYETKKLFRSLPDEPDKRLRFQHVLL